MDPAMPNPLVSRACDPAITTGPVNGEELSFYNGVDARGRKWSRIIGSKALREGLLEGVISEWDDERQAYVEVARVGPVRPGEKVAITFRGFSTIQNGPHKGKEIPSVKVERPDAQKTAASGGAPTKPDLPFAAVMI